MAPGRRLGTVHEPARDVDVVHETELLVVGSGPAGLAAALAGARAGVEVTLVERFGCFGGNITAVGVEGMAWYRHERTVDAGGIAREFEERAQAMGAAVPESQSLSYELDAEGFKVVADRLVEEAGIHADAPSHLRRARARRRRDHRDRDRVQGGARGDPRPPRRRRHRRRRRRRTARARRRA